MPTGEIVKLDSTSACQKLNELQEYLKDLMFLELGTSTFTNYKFSDHGEFVLRMSKNVFSSSRNHFG
jgi:hypothetical protein